MLKIGFVAVFFVGIYGLLWEWSSSSHHIAVALSQNISLSWAVLIAGVSSLFAWVKVRV